jgi:RNA polymerase sigma-70 factor, ECF subfamily
MVLSESITQLLIKWSHGDESALEKLTPFVYDELRRLAQNYINQERSGHTLQATALVHEAFVKLLEMPQIDWQNRSHFVGLAANIMRRILVDHARIHNTEKRGGGNQKLPISRAERISFKRDLSLIELDEALEKLSKDFPRKAQVVELRFFGGLSNEEIASVLTVGETKVSLRTVERDWEFAKAWLYQQLNRTGNNDEHPA